MNIANIKQRTQKIITEPQREFLKIAKEDKQPLKVFTDFVLPFILLYIVASYLGKIVFSPATFNVGTGVVLKSILLIAAVTISGIYFSAITINEILPLFHAKRNRLKSFALVSYALTPTYLMLILAGLIPNLAMIIYFIGFYSLILFWIGAAAIIDMTKERRQIFVPIGVFAMILIFLINRLILGAIFSL